MSLIENMTALNARLLRLPQKLGVPRYQRRVQVIKSYLPTNQILPVETAIDILPSPKLQPVPPRLVGSILSNDVIVTEKDLEVSDIVMSYGEDDLIGEWVIDGKRGYKLLQLIPGLTTYTAIVQAPIDKAFNGNFSNEIL